MANIGLCFVNPSPLTKPENIVNFAKKCEAMGLHSMWTIDRIAYDNLEPLTLLAAAAGATTNAFTRPKQSEAARKKLNFMVWILDRSEAVGQRA